MWEKEEAEIRDITLIHTTFFERTRAFRKITCTTEMITRDCLCILEGWGTEMLHCIAIYGRRQVVCSH